MRLRKRKLPSGIETYFLDDYHNGERIRESLGITIPRGADPVFAKNQKRLAEHLFQRRQEEILRARKGEVMDDGIALVTYAEKLTEGRDKQDHVVRMLPYLRNHFGAQELRTIDYRSCDAFQAYLQKAVSPTTEKPLSAKTVRHYFNALAYVLNEAVRERYLERSPATSVRRVRVPEKVVIALTQDELQKLWAVPINGALGAAVRIAFFVSANTGLRLGDVRSLRWGDIETGPNGWKLAKAQDKTGNRILVPLNDNVKELLTPRFSLAPTAPVFPELQTGSDIAKYVTPWVKAAGLEKRVTFHTARHTFGTLLAEAGGNALVVQNLMGHTTRTMTEHYVQTAGREARGLVDSLPKLGAGNA